MYDLTNLTAQDAARLSTDLAKLGSGASSMEDAGNRIVGFLHENTVDPKTKTRACALVRVYKTQAYKDLSSELQNFAQGILGHAPKDRAMKCLTLLATAGEKPEWNSRKNSVGHKAIPLPDESFVSKIPMISRLVSQFGLDIKAVVHPDPNLLADLKQKSYNAFHVPEAVGSPYIPAQQDFVIRHGVRSVLGFGGMLSSGDLFAVILFSKVQIPRQTADLAKDVALKTKESLEPFVGGRIFAAA